MQAGYTCETLILSRVPGSVTNYKEFWIGWLDLFSLPLQLSLISIRALNRWLPKTRSIPSWTTSIFSSTVADVSDYCLLLTNSLLVYLGLLL
jgi:hypothetical protein